MTLSQEPSVDFRNIRIHFQFLPNEFRFSSERNYFFSRKRAFLSKTTAFTENNKTDNNSFDTGLFLAVGI